MIYFIQAGEDGPIKVGYVDGESLDHVELRRALLQVGNHQILHTRAVIPGSYSEERALHRRFASGHIRGEWFLPETSGMAEAIESAHEQQTVVAWQLREDGRQLCEWCGTAEVLPPRKTLCSDECASERKRARARR
jgi:hypothetical protein